MKPKTPVLWRASKYNNLRVYVPSGTYYIHASVGGKLFRKSTDTTDPKAAQEIRDKLLADERAKAKDLPSGSFAATCDSWLERFKASGAASETKRYKDQLVTAIIDEWPNPEQSLRDITRKDCENWSEKFRDRFGYSRFNGGLQTLRAVLNDAGCDVVALLKNIEFKPVRPKKAVIPSRADIHKIIAAMGKLVRKKSHLIAKLIVQSGMRSKEVKASRVEHIEWSSNRLKILGAKGKGDEPKIRYLPINPSLADTLREIVGERTSGLLFEPQSIQKSLTSACKTVGVPRISPHDLRDVFTTTCIESGVDFHTLAGWLGHSDGGALLMKTYAHLRDEHSQLMSKRVKF